MVLLDTHVWVWYLLGTGALTPRQRAALDRLAAGRNLALSWVSVWEFEMLERKGRVQLNIPLGVWLEKALHPSFLTLIPVDTGLVLAQRTLPEAFHGDPADRLITATALALDLPLATFDRKIAAVAGLKRWE